jgi:Kef-type K+ transport system membrane component KefB
MIAAITDLTLPLANPILKFLVILLIILMAPIILNRFKIPHLLGLIIAGAVIGPNGFNLILRDSGIVMSGTVGLLYIMFLAGLEIDLAQFRRNSFRSIVFGLYTFLIPMGIGTLAGYYLLGFSMPSSVLLASMFASHTLIAYPIISKLGLSKNRAVNIAVGGTMITDTLALLVLAVIVGMSQGAVNQEFWITLSASLVVFGLIVALLFPLIARWFFKKYSDPVMQYVMVLVLVFCGAVLAELAGVEGIIGAFLAGLALNRLIPNTSSLMNKIDFVGNAVFIPFFLIGVGMLVDYRAFFQGFDTIIVAVVMTVVAAFAKFAAAWLTQKSFRLSSDERKLIFGLSNAQAAATLAAVTVGYNVILGYSDSGEPIRLLGESVLNGTIVMILVTCTIASFSAQKGAHNIVMQLRNQPMDNDEYNADNEENILIALRHPEKIEELVNLGITLKTSPKKGKLIALNVVTESDHEPWDEKSARRLLDKATWVASAADRHIEKLIRFDISVVNGIVGVIREKKITDIVLGLNQESIVTESFLGNLTNGLLVRSDVTTFVYKNTQPFSTIRRHVVLVPENAEREIGFPFWLVKVWNLAAASGAKLVFYASEATISLIQSVKKKYPIEAEMHLFNDWDDFLIIAREIRPDDNMIIVLSRRNKLSFKSNMLSIPVYLNKYFLANSFILVYPMQSGGADDESKAYLNPSMLEPFEKLDDIRKEIFRLFKRI